MFQYIIQIKWIHFNKLLLDMWWLYYAIGLVCDILFDEKKKLEVKHESYPTYYRQFIINRVSK